MFTTKKTTQDTNLGSKELQERIGKFFTDYFNKHPLSRQDIKNKKKDMENNAEREQNSNEQPEQATSPSPFKK